MNKEKLDDISKAKDVDQAIIPELINLLKNDDLKYSVARTLGNIITKEPICAKIIREKLMSSNTIIQYYLIVAICYAEENVDGFIPDLILFLSNKDDGLRGIAANTLGQIKSLVAVPYLVKIMCNDPSKDVRYYAMHALGDIKDQKIIMQLINLIQKNNLETRMYAIHILGKMRQHAKEAIPYIFPYLQDNDEKMSAIAATALGNLGDQRARAILEKISSSSFVLSAKKALENLKMDENYSCDRNHF